MDHYEGGWQDCLPTAGSPCEYNRQQFGVHGETPTIPWDYCIAEDTPERVAVRFWVRTYRTPFYVEKELSLERGKATLAISERVVNEGRTTMHMLWGQHPALGAPFVDESCVIDLPGGRALYAPRQHGSLRVSEWPCARQDGTISRVVSASGPRIPSARRPPGWFGITNTRRKVGFGMAWPSRSPALCFWQAGGACRPPWYGRTYDGPGAIQFRLLQPADAIADGSALVLGQANLGPALWRWPTGIERVSRSPPMTVAPAAEAH